MAHGPMCFPARKVNFRFSMLWVIPFTWLLVGVWLRAADEKPSDDPFARPASITVKDPIMELVPDPQGRTYFPKESASYYTYYLSAMAEPSLMAAEAANEGEKWRFTWLRSFHNPIAVRVWQSGTDYHIRAVELKRKEDYGAGPAVTDTSRLLTQEELAEIRRLTKAGNFWTPLTPDEKSATGGGLDGAQWIFEHREDKVYAMLDLWTPKDYGRKQFKEAGLDLTKIRDFDPYVQLGLYLLKITKLLPKEGREVY